MSKTSVKPFTAVLVVTPGILLLFIFVAFFVVQFKTTEPPGSTVAIFDSSFTSGFGLFCLFKFVKDCGAFN